MDGLHRQDPNDRELLRAYIGERHLVSHEIVAVRPNFNPTHSSEGGQLAIAEVRLPDHQRMQELNRL
jgi:hypothetical protein